MALNDGDWRWEAILLDSDMNAVAESKKNWSLKGYRHHIKQLQTSPTPPLFREKVQHVCCTLYRMP